MEKNEDLSTNAVVEQGEQDTSITANEGEETKIEVVNKEDNTPTSEEIDLLLSEILKTEEKELNIRPTFDNKVEEVKVEETKVEEKYEEAITENDLIEIDGMLDSLEKEVEEKTKIIEENTKTINELTENFNNIESELKSKLTDIELLEQGILKIQEHPIIGPLAVKLINGEELDIPNYLIKSIDNDINAIPDMDGINNIGENPIKKTKTAHDMLKEHSKKFYY